MDKVDEIEFKTDTDKKYLTLIAPQTVLVVLLDSQSTQMSMMIILDKDPYPPTKMTVVDDIIEACQIAKASAHISNGDIFVKFLHTSIYLLRMNTEIITSHTNETLVTLATVLVSQQISVNILHVFVCFQFRIINCLTLLIPSTFLHFNLLTNHFPPLT